MCFCVAEVDTDNKQSSSNLHIQKMQSSPQIVQTPKSPLIKYINEQWPPD